MRARSPSLVSLRAAGFLCLPLLLNRVRRNLLVPVTLVQIHFDRHFTETEMIAEHTQQISSVVIAERFGFTANQDNRWRLRRDLGGVIDRRPCQRR